MKNTLRNIVTGSALLGSLLMAGTAFAATPVGHGGFPMSRPAVVGTVATAPGANGTFTVTSKGWARPGTNAAPATLTTYTVTTTSATVTKTGASSTVSAIVVGDQVMIKGTVSGTSVIATSINVSNGKMGRSEKINDPKIGHSEKIPAKKTAARAPHKTKTPKVTTSSTSQAN